jgi:hypothetical protein
MISKANPPTLSFLPEADRMRRERVRLSRDATTRSSRWHDERRHFETISRGWPICNVLMLKKITENIFLWMELMQPSLQAPETLPRAQSWKHTRETEVRPFALLSHWLLAQGHWASGLRVGLREGAITVGAFLPSPKDGNRSSSINVVS